MNKLTLFLICYVLVLVSCKNMSTTSEVQSDGAGSYYGDKIDTVGMISYVKLLDELTKKDSVEAKVFGQVSAVCQTKGCWMNVVSKEDTTHTEMFVQFKDYGFFMPKDLAGKEVVMQGKAFTEETSVEDLKHYAEDEGLSADEIAKITEPKTELKFLASGVLIKK